MRLTTLCFLIREDSVLLALKKRGFGAGKWNGVGGKVESGENIRGAAVREAQEEIGVSVREENLEERAVLTFLFHEEPLWNQECHVFFTEHFEGDPCESDEMKPKWFPISDIPFGSMWKDDPLWFPRTLAGEQLRATFRFSREGEVLAHEVTRMMPHS